MPDMTRTQLEAFGALQGAYSSVTEREATGDRSVTLDKYEKRILGSCYALESFPRQAREQRRSDFIVKNELGESRQQLSVKFPKRTNNELRLYMADAQRFSGRTDDTFFIYVKEGSLIPYVGFMHPDEWERISAPVVNPPDADELDDDAAFQGLLNREYRVDGRAAVQLSGMRIPRDPNAAREALASANYVCEIDRDHETFVCAELGRSYVEAHHLMPLSRQPSHPANLDVPANIIALCPNCHRKIHYGNARDRQEMLSRLYLDRQSRLEASNLDFTISQLFQAYNVI